jgi:hypothetical protein
VAAVDACSESRELLEEQLEEWVLSTQRRLQEAQADHRVVDW